MGRKSSVRSSIPLHPLNFHLTIQLGLITEIQLAISNSAVLCLSNKYAVPSTSDPVVVQSANYSFCQHFAITNAYWWCKDQLLQVTPVEQLMVQSGINILVHNCIAHVSLTWCLLDNIYLPSRFLHCFKTRKRGCRYAIGCLKYQTRNTSWWTTFRSPLV